jgi:hypothetical protein
MARISSRPSKDSDGAEEQERHYREHHQVPRLKHIKQSPHSSTPATPLSHEIRDCEKNARPLHFLPTGFATIELAERIEVRPQAEPEGTESNLVSL